jgi:hypothetical protein
MLDKLEMRTKECIDPRALKSLFPGHQISLVPDRWYNYCAIIKRGTDHILTLKTEADYGHVSPSKIIINPTKWESFEEVTGSLSSICNPSMLEITRIDHAVDLEAPIETIHSGLRVRYKQDSDGYKEREKASKKKGKLTGFYLGKRPELYCCYDKGYQLEGKGLKRNSAFPTGETSRIELRQWGNKIAHKTLAELPNYIDDSPFKHLEFYEINRESDRGNELADLIEREGLSNVYHLKNQSRNFRRDYSTLLTRTNFPETLTQSYRNDLQEFLKATTFQEFPNKELENIR